MSCCADVPVRDAGCLHGGRLAERNRNRTGGRSASFVSPGPALCNPSHPGRESRDVPSVDGCDVVSAQPMRQPRPIRQPRPADEAAVVRAVDLVMTTPLGDGFSPMGEVTTGDQVLHGWMPSDAPRTAPRSVTTRLALAKTLSHNGSGSSLRVVRTSLTIVCSWSCYLIGGRPQ